MLEIYLASDPVNAEIIKDYLRGYGIEAIVRGQFLWGGRGELPADSYPRIWVVRDEQADEARQLIRKLESGRIDGSSWECPRCAERLGGQFTACWNCGQQRT